ncbi:TIGR04255 family protein [Metallumcola ferriviriculae]|uniref:TIGR04255 family protein n=1 Tax=Metallumcola ferriviriculae TaxID=3039180 RepID=A0AAU0UKL8_9FIRM|nr:TIGR04255 family protein [Desulfitibacteraceae bacterium MK1]
MIKKYNNAPITEALCEFSFASQQDWDWTIPGLIYERIKVDYPKKKQVQQHTVELNINEDGMKNPSPVEIGISKMQFFKEDESSLVQIAPNVLVINQLKPYPGWKVFKEQIDKMLSLYESVASPEGINKIGVRYINNFSFDEDITISEYFNIKPSYPLSRESKSFLMRNDLLYEECKSVLNLIMAKKPDDKSIILDFNFTTDQMNLDNATQWIEEAHYNIEEAFEACLTSNLREIIE